MTYNQTCDCGSELYNVKVTEDRQEVWAACAKCGRPTAVMGDGFHKQHVWEVKKRAETAPDAEGSE